MTTTILSAPTQNLHFTEPRISKANPNDWYVWFRYFHEGRWQPKKYREGINLIKDKKVRQEAAEALLQSRLEWLQAGWNPVLDPEFAARKVILESKQVELMNFNQSLSFALEKKKKGLAKKSIRDYSNIIAIMQEHAIKTGLANMPVQNVTRRFILGFLDTITQQKNFSNHRYNTYKNTLRSMFTELLKWEIVQNNPCILIEDRKVAESDLFACYTEDEKERIAAHLTKKHYPLFILWQTLYHTGIRPKELLALRIEDIDLNTGIITILPDLDEENAKTPFIRRVPINTHLCKLLKKQGLEMCDATFFAFGSPFKPGEGNRGAGSQKWGKRNKYGMGYKTGKSGALRDDFLMPSPYQAARDTVTKLWKKLVKDDLGIDKCMYAAKHTGADDKILAGIDLDVLRHLYGHRSKQMTERYTKSLQLKYNDILKECSPDFFEKNKAAKIRRIA